MSTEERNDILLLSFYGVCGIVIAFTSNSRWSWVVVALAVVAMGWLLVNMFRTTFRGRS